MASRQSRHLGAAILGAAFLTAAAGPMASSGSGQGPGAAQRPADKAEDGQPSPDDQVEALVREYDEARAVMMSRPLDLAAFRENSKAREKSLAETNQLERLRQDVGKRLLELAERHPRTNAAEQALTWLVCDRGLFDRRPELDRAQELLARDHARSDRIKAVLAETSPSSLWASAATENLLRRVLERSPYYEIRGLACYRLARIFIERAEHIRIWQLLGSPPENDLRTIPGGPEQADRLMKSDPRQLEEAAVPFLERVIAEFPRIFENLRGKTSMDSQLGGPAKSDLDRIRRLSIGMPAPRSTGSTSTASR